MTSDDRTGPPRIVRRVLERKLAQWAIAYLAGAWLVLQVLDLLSDAFGRGPLGMRRLTILLGVGLLAVLVLAWYHGERGSQRVTGMELLMLAGILVLAGAAVTLVGRGDAPARAAYVSPVMRAYLYVALGERARTLELLEEAALVRDPLFLYYAPSDPGFEPIRADPRFRSVLARYTGSS